MGTPPARVPEAHTDMHAASLRADSPCVRNTPLPWKNSLPFQVHCTGKGNGFWERAEPGCIMGPGCSQVPHSSGRLQSSSPGRMCGESSEGGR